MDEHDGRTKDYYLQPRGRTDYYLLEASYEVCNQLGGIYTVLRSKVYTSVPTEKKRYCLIGPYNARKVPGEFDPLPLTGPFGRVVAELEKKGFEAHYGTWLVTGKPRVVLLNLNSVTDRLAEIKYFFWKNHGISTPDDALINSVFAFGFLVEQFIATFVKVVGTKRPIIAHFHEWMGGTALIGVRASNLPVATVFTTHATMLGRHLAIHDPWFYEHLPEIDWRSEAYRFNIEPQVLLERLMAKRAHIFTTVSSVTANECKYLLGREVDFTLPNGLIIERFGSLHEFQNLHRLYKEKIHDFVRGHFFPSYSFDLDNTLYFVISGRYEYKNKGYDLVLESIARLNQVLKAEGEKKTIITFFVTQRPFYSVNPDELSSRALLIEILNTCETIQGQVGRKLYELSALGHTPKLDDLVDEYWRLRLRRNVQTWRTTRLPLIVTHNLVDDKNDEILNKMRTANLLNFAEDPVKVVYHPDFITSSSPLFGMEYDQFVRGCHLGMFPSFYEPWGYTPLECIARGVPAVTSDLSGFGAFVKDHVADYEAHGIHIVNRSTISFDQSADDIAKYLYSFVQLDRRGRIALRNKVQAVSEQFQWRHLIKHYYAAYDSAIAELLKA
jgi:glycogen(starch) synthase